MRRFGPMEAGDYSVGKTCPACLKMFVVGDFTALVPLGPGADPEAQEKARRGHPYNAVAAQVHWDCADNTQ